MLLSKEKPVKFLLHPGFTEEQINEKILADEAIFMEEPVYQFVMFAIHQNFKQALEEVQDGLEYDVLYVSECDLAAVSEDGTVVVLFKPKEPKEDYLVSTEITEYLKTGIEGFHLDGEEEELPEVTETMEEESSSEDWDGWL